MAAEVTLIGESVQAAELTGRKRLVNSERFKGLTRGWAGWLFAVPALAFYAMFNLRPVIAAVQYSFFNWDGIGPSNPGGLRQLQGCIHRPGTAQLAVPRILPHLFFTALPLLFGLIAAATMRSIEGRFTGALARTVLFLPQIIPGAATGVAWIWMYSSDGTVNQILRLIGLGGIARPWLGDFNFALIAVGFIGTWLQTGFVTLLLMSGIGKIDATLYEAARLDGAGPIAQFCSITLPGLRQEMGVAVTVWVCQVWLAPPEREVLALSGSTSTRRGSFLRV